MSLVIGILGRPNKMEREIITFSKAVIDVIGDNNAVSLGIIPSNKDLGAKLSIDEKEKLYQLIDYCDGIILQGGTDCYAYDIEAIKYINKKNMPVLGICLGMQSLAIATGGKMVNVENHKHVGVDYVHKVDIDIKSKFFNIIKESTLMVNSRHLEQIINPGKYKAVGYSPDKVIEILEEPTKDFNIGVQWHPEDLYLSDNKMKLIFKSFFSYCFKYQEKK